MGEDELIACLEALGCLGISDHDLIAFTVGRQKMVAVWSFKRANFPKLKKITSEINWEERCKERNGSPLRELISWPESHTVSHSRDRRPLANRASWLICKQKAIRNNKEIYHAWKIYSKGYK